MKLCLSSVILSLVCSFVFSEAPWSYHENIDEMDDSVFRYVLSESELFDEDKRMFIFTGCEDTFEHKVDLKRPQGVFFDYYEDGSLDVVLRFDKEVAAAPDESYVWDSNTQYATIRLEGMRKLLLKHSVLRVKGLFDQRTVIRFDLLDYNRAFKECP